MALALAHPRTAPTGHRTTRTQLTAHQLDVFDVIIDILGAPRGLVEDEPRATDAAHRQSLSTIAAKVVGIAITPGHEIAECYDCEAVLDGAYAVEDEGRIRCEPCRETWAHDSDLHYGLPDTTWDA